MSYGGYIYSYSSKWNGVYWPFTDEMWVWACPSGFVAFGSDKAFSEEYGLEPDEHSRIAAALKELETLKNTSEAKWSRLTALEPLRDRTISEQAHFARLMVDKAPTETLAAEAMQYAKPLTEEALAAEEDVYEQTLLNFVLGVYSERAGDLVAADDWFRQVRSVVWMDEEGIEQTGMPYFNELILEVENARQGIVE